MSLERKTTFLKSETKQKQSAPVIDERTKALLMMQKEDMTLGQLFEFARVRPEELDGFQFEQKINRTISDEFTRLQAKVDGAFEAVTKSYQRMFDFEQKIDVCRSQMSRIGKFDGLIESFTRQATDNSMQMQQLSDRVLDINTQIRQNSEQLSKRIYKCEGDVREVNRLIDQPKEKQREQRQQLESLVSDAENRVVQKYLEFSQMFSEFQEQNTKTLIELQGNLSKLQVSCDTIIQPLKQHDINLQEQRKELNLHKIVVEELLEHVEAIQKHSQLTNLHLEAYLPFQVASQCYEISSVLANGKAKASFRKGFQKKIEELEQNLLTCCNPQNLSQSKSKFKLIHYELPQQFLFPPLQEPIEKGQDDEQKLLKQQARYKREQQNRQATRDQSVENVFILFGGVGIDQLNASLRKELFGFKYAVDHEFRINKEKQKEDAIKASKQQNNKDPLNDIGALRMQMNFDLMKTKVNIESMMKKQFAEMKESHSEFESRLEKKQAKFDGDKAMLMKDMMNQKVALKMVDELTKAAIKKQQDAELNFTYQMKSHETFIVEKIETVIEKKLNSLKQEIQIQRESLKDKFGLKQSNKNVSFKPSEKELIVPRDRLGGKSQTINYKNQSNRSLETHSRISQLSESSDSLSLDQNSGQDKEENLIKASGLEDQKLSQSVLSQGQVSINDNEQANTDFVINENQVLNQDIEQQEKQQYHQSKTQQDPKHFVLHHPKRERKQSEIIYRTVPITISSVDDTKNISEERESDHQNKDTLPNIIEDLAENQIEEIEQKEVKNEIDIGQLDPLSTKQEDISVPVVVKPSQELSKVSPEISQQLSSRNSPIPSPVIVLQDQNSDTMNLNNEKLKQMIMQQKQSSNRLLNFTSSAQTRNPDVKNLTGLFKQEQDGDRFYQTAKPDIIAKDLRSLSENQSSGSSPGQRSKQSKQSLTGSSKKKNVNKNKISSSNLEGDLSGRAEKKIQLKKTQRDSDDDQIQSDYDGEIGEASDYDDEEEEEEEVEYALLNDFLIFKQSQLQTNQDLKDELVKKDQLIEFLRQEFAQQVEQNLVFMDTISKVDFGIIEKAEIKVNNAITSFETMFDTYKKVIMTDIKRWRQENVDMQIKYKKESSKIELMTHVVARLNERAGKFQQIVMEWIANIQEVSEYQVKLNKQDDLDKQSFSLAGIKEKEVQMSHTNHRNSVTSTQNLQTNNQASISLDPRCLNCELDPNQKQLIFQKFKIACLSYKPGPVIMNGGLIFSREEVVNLQEQCLKVLETNKTLAREYLLSFNTNVSKQLTQIDDDLPNKVGEIQLPAEIRVNVDTKDRKPNLPDSVKEKRQKFTIAINQSQAYEANRFNLLRKDMISQPGSQREKHKILIFEHAGSIGASTNSIESSNLPDVYSSQEYKIQVGNINTDRSAIYSQRNETIDHSSLPMISARSYKPISQIDNKKQGTAISNQRTRMSQTINGFNK